MSFESDVSKLNQKNYRKHDLRDGSLSKLFVPTQKINKLNLEMKNTQSSYEFTSFENVFGTKRRLSQLTYFDKQVKNPSTRTNVHFNELPHIDERFIASDNDPKTNWTRNSLIRKPKLEEELRLKRLYQITLFKSKMNEYKQLCGLKRNYLTYMLLKNPKVDPNKVYYYMKKSFVK